MSFILSLVVLILANLSLAGSAYAYIDPNTGGFFFQTVAPFIYGILGAIVIFWKRIAAFFRGLVGKKDDNGSKEDL